jgi:hypothetical protein
MNLALAASEAREDATEGKTAIVTAPVPALAVPSFSACARRRSRRRHRPDGACAEAAAGIAPLADRHWFHDRRLCTKDVDAMVERTVEQFAP